MNCKTCGYRLWNLPSRACPECGSSFKPSDFEFAPNAVQFVCPACEQEYYGTSPIGHLVPTEFDCVRCGKHLHMDEMLVRPADWAREDYTGAAVNPWLERAKVGRIKAFFAMIGWGMAQPGRLMKATPPDSSANQAWWYVIISFLIYNILGYLPIAAFFTIAAISAARSVGGGAGAIVGTITPLAGLGVSLLVALLLIAIWGAVAHVCLIGGRPQGSIRRTYHAICYTSGPMCVAAVPCLGVYFLWIIGVIWWVVSAAVAVREAQQVHPGRAAAAVIAWPAVVFLIIVGLFVWMMVGISTAMSSISTSFGGGVTSLGFAVMSHAQADPNGHGPTHALELTNTQPWIDGYTFVAPTSGTSLSDVKLAGSDLDQFESASPTAKPALVQQAVNAQPANLVAHRLGDYVFTYHGADLKNTPPGDLWLVIFSPDPAVNPPPAPSDYCEIARADGSLYRFQYASLTAELAQQNTLRATLSLPPLPDPVTVTDTQPAVGP